MLIARQPAIVKFTPEHSRLPVLGSGLWYPLRGSGLPGIEGLPTMLEVVDDGANHAAEWTTFPGGYTFPVDNGGGTDAAHLVAASTDDDEYLDRALGLSDAAIGSELIVAWEGAWVQQEAATRGTWWVYGQDSEFSMFGVGLDGSEPALFWRGYGATAASDGAAPVNTGQVLADYEGQGRTAFVLSVHKTGTFAATVTLLVGHATVGTASYVWEVDFSANDGAAPPGRHGAAAADHVGLTVGATPDADGTAWTDYLGTGAANTASAGNVEALRFDEYDATRAADVLAALVACPMAFATPLLRD